MRKIIGMIYLFLILVLFVAVVNKNKLNYSLNLIDKKEYELYVIIYFSPDCDLCHNLLLKLNDCSDEIYFNLVSLNNLVEINKFVREINLFGKKNITFVYDKELKYYDELKIVSIPSVFIYSSKKKLMFNANGYIDIVDVINYLLKK